MDPLTDLVLRARRSDAEACGELVHATQTMVHGVALGVLRDRALAQDAAQQAYVRAFRRLHDLETPAAFTGWLRRIVVTVALNMRRRRRSTLLRLDDVPDVPVLDEAETYWTDAQRLRLAAALLTLAPEDRQLCDRRHHGGWSTARLAAVAGVSETAMRKRMQRIRDRLRTGSRWRNNGESDRGISHPTCRRGAGAVGDREPDRGGADACRRCHLRRSPRTAPARRGSHPPVRPDASVAARGEYAGQPMRVWSAGKVF